MHIFKGKAYVVFAFMSLFLVQTLQPSLAESISLTNQFTLQFFDVGILP